MNKFENKTVLITGGSRGIGKAIALKFANQGANIIFNYLRNHQAALETFNQITSLGVKCKKIKAHLQLKHISKNQNKNLIPKWISILMI